MNAVTTERHLFSPDPSKETQHWLERVDKTASVVLEHREQAERDRVTPRPVFEALREAGLPRMWVSREFGGEQVPIETGVEALQALARLDGSAGWQMSVQGAVGRMSDYLPEDTARLMFRDHSGLVIGGINPAGGRAEETEGGFTLSGEWAFASGCAFADWFVCAALVTDGGEIRRTAAGPDMRMLFVPRSEVELLDTWYTTGLRGTGSTHFRVTGAHVPHAFTVRMADMYGVPPERASRRTPWSPSGRWSPRRRRSAARAPWP